MEKYFWVPAAASNLKYETFNLNDVSTTALYYCYYSDCSLIYIIFVLTVVMLLTNTFICAHQVSFVFSCHEGLTCVYIVKFLRDNSSILDPLWGIRRNKRSIKMRSRLQTLHGGGSKKACI